MSLTPAMIAGLQLTMKVGGLFWQHYITNEN